MQLKCRSPVNYRYAPEKPLVPLTRDFIGSCRLDVNAIGRWMCRRYLTVISNLTQSVVFRVGESLPPGAQFWPFLAAKISAGNCSDVGLRRLQDALLHLFDEAVELVPVQTDCVLAVAGVLAGDVPIRHPGKLLTLGRQERHQKRIEGDFLLLIAKP